MFNNRKDEAPFGVATNGPSVSAVSKSSPSGHSIVDERLTMKGDLESDGDILVKGKVLGNIRCEVLIIDVDALVEGGVEAKEVVIRGKLNGKIQASRVNLEKTAEVDSEIFHDTFAAEEGARIKGSLCLNGEGQDGQANDVKAKDSVRNKKVLRAVEEVDSAPAEGVQTNGATA